MQATDQPLGLRERKKIKTRQAIRREAFRLFDAHGFAATTVEQIADAAEVSPSTFFRYFPSKESLLLADDLSEFENTRQRLIFSIPELKAALYDEYHRTVTVMAEAIGDRIGRPADDFEVRVFVGAMVGAMMAAYDSAPITAETIYRALDFLDAGMPLSGPGPRTR
jgi:AcrR family transcriptional regulator